MCDKFKICHANLPIFIDCERANGAWTTLLTLPTFKNKRANSCDHHKSEFRNHQSQRLRNKTLRAIKPRASQPF
ncbi:MAG: hypothetical protein B6D41_04190 [Chloroflexi bacterium UTCFX4]|nr:MAG: hypothetical protein B6D41_04190 [Chloroflexi bacterium UTCFX4]